MSKKFNNLLVKRVNSFGGYYAPFGLLISLFGKEKIALFNKSIEELKDKYNDMLNIPEYTTKISNLQLIATNHRNKTEIMEPSEIKSIREQISDIGKKLTNLHERRNDLASIEAAQLYIDMFN